MTSKEALEKIKEEAIENEYPEGWFVKELECIKHDLDLLDTIKPLLKSMYDMVKNYNEDRLITLYCNNEMKYKIKDWLK